MKIRLLTRLLFLFALGFMSAAGATAQTASEPQPVPGGRILVARVVGEVTVVNPADGLTFPVRNGSLLMEGQVISTGPGASVLFVLSNGATVSVGADSVLSIDQFTQQPFTETYKMNALVAEPTTSTTRLNLLRGEIISDVKKLNQGGGSSFTIQTPVGAAGIRGTAFRLAFKPEGNRASFALVMLEGVIEQTFGRGRPVRVEQGKQIVLSGLTYNAGTGEVSGIPASIEPADVPASVRASLLQMVQQMLSSVGSLTISSSVVPTGNGAAGASGGPTMEAAPATGPSEPVSPLSPSPGPQLPPPRTSPTDGLPRA